MLANRRHARVGGAEVLGGHVLADEVVGGDVRDRDPVGSRDEYLLDEVLSERVHVLGELVFAFFDLRLGALFLVCFEGRRAV